MIPLLKKITSLSFLFFTPIFLAVANAYSFLDEIDIYWDWAGIYLAFFGIIYAIVGLIVKKWRKQLLIMGGVLCMIGVIVFICFYGYAYTSWETEGGWYY